MTMNHSEVDVMNSSRHFVIIVTLVLPGTTNNYKMNSSTSEQESQKPIEVPTRKVSRFQIIVDSLEEEVWPPRIINLKPAPEIEPV